MFLLNSGVVAWLSGQRSEDLFLIARRWGRLSAALGHGGADLMIAATALERGLTVVTRNLERFQPTGVATLNPWSPPA